MTTNDFVDRIRIAVYDQAIEGTISLLEKPPGRSPSKQLVTMSEWYNKLPQADKEVIRMVIELTARGSVFGMLAVLDGVRAIRVAGESGELELRYSGDGKSILLNDPDKEFLHDIFGLRVPPL